MAALTLVASVGVVCAAKAVGATAVEEEDEEEDEEEEDEEEDEEEEDEPTAPAPAPSKVVGCEKAKEGSPIVAGRIGVEASALLRKRSHQRSARRDVPARWDRPMDQEASQGRRGRRGSCRA